MKLSLIVILLSFLFIVKGQDTSAEDFSIQAFVNYLQENNYWEILVQVSVYFGDDVAIEVCKSFVPSPHCEEVVRVYIQASANSKMRKEGKYNNLNEMEDLLVEKQYSNILKRICKPKIKYYLLLNKIIMKFS